jgi:hypothetical protein
MRYIRRANSSIALGVGFNSRFYSNFFIIYIYYFIVLMAFIALVTLARKRVFGRKGVRAITDETKGVCCTEGHVRTCRTRALVVSISSLICF